MKKQLIRQFHGLMSTLGIKDQKENMLAAYGVESTGDLTVDQLNDLVTRLRQMFDKKEAPKAIRRKRSIVLDLLTRLEVYSGSGDWTRVNNYLMQPRIAGKLLYELNEEELKALSIKLRVILNKKQKAQKAQEYLILNN